MCAHIPQANEITCLSTANDHNNQMLPVDGASTAVKLRNLR